MRINKRNFKHILMPIFVGGAMGLAAALVSVYGGRTLSLGLSSAQESISFYGFLATGLVYGVAESLSRWRK